jgi:hypothetical protein
MSLFESFNFEKIILLKDFSTDSLISTVRAFTRTPSVWVTDLGSGAQNVPAAKCTVHEAMGELTKRHEANKAQNKVKELISVLTTDKVVTMSPTSLSVQGKIGVSPLTVCGGHIVMGKSPEVVSEQVKTTIARDNIIDAAVFPIISPANSKTLEVVTEDKAAKLKFPLYPVSTVFGVESSRTEIVAACRTKAKVVPEVINTLAKMFPVSMVWSGVSFAMEQKFSCPEKYNALALYTILADHRAIRGADTGIRSDSSRGYYFGYMPTSLYRACCVVIDIVYLGQVDKTNCLEIRKVDGLFSVVVLQSLVANGWVIRVRTGYDLPEHPKDAKELIPGIYSKVSFHHCLVHESIDDKVPTLSGGVIITSKINGHLLDLPKNEGRTVFTYCYYRDDFREISKNLYPTAHAHSAQMIYCQRERLDDIDLLAYMKRTIRANTYKTFHVYTRALFYIVDDFAYQGSVRIAQKTVKTFDDVDIRIDSEFVKAWEYTGQYIPQVVAVRLDSIEVKSPDSLSLEERALLNSLKQNDDIIIQQPNISVENDVLEGQDSDQI